ncbi:hypothetical protein Tco_0493895, partial [Tanacetum coccineum]
DTESDDIIQRKELNKKATKKATVKKNQANKKNKRKSTESESKSESESDFAVGTFDNYNEVEQAEAKVVEVKSKTNDKKAINSRMSPRNLKRVLDSLTTSQQKRLKQMGFGEFARNFDFDYVPGIMGMWVVKDFNPKTCTLVMEDGSMIKITRELIHDMLGIPMSGIKVKPLKEKNLFDPVTTKWRGMVPEIVNREKIHISQLETFLCTLSEADWLFDIGFLSLFFSISSQGNKDGTINERLIPYLEKIDKIHQMDWCSYVLESLVKECTGFSSSDKFIGPLLLLALIYVNSTVSKNVKVEKTVRAFKACLQFIKTKKVNKKKKLKSIAEDEDETPEKVEQKEDFHYKTFKGDLEKDVDDEEKDRDDEEVYSQMGINEDDDDKDENSDNNDDDDETDGDNDDVTDVNNDDNDEDDDDENDDNDENDENDENIRNEKEKKGGSENVKDDNVEESITNMEQKDENMEEEKEKKMIEDMTKLPLISGALKESTHDVPPVDARPSSNKLKFEVKRDSDGIVHAKKIDDVSCDNEVDNTNRNKDLPKITRKKVATKNVVEQTIEMEKLVSDTESDDIIQRKELKKKATKKAHGKRVAVEKDYDSEDAMCAKKKRKGNKPEDNMMVAYKPEEAKVVDVKSKTNYRKAIIS